MAVEEIKEMVAIAGVQSTVSGLRITDTPLSEVVFIAFDTETTGLNPIVSNIVELSGVKFASSGEELSRFSTLINPLCEIPPQVSAIHGITDDMVQDAPTCAAVLPEFIEWATTPERSPNMKGRIADETVLLAHNAGFDVSFLEVALCRACLDMPENMVLDTLSLARRVIDSPNYQLKTLTEHLGFSSSTYHRALADSYHVRDLFLAIAQQFGPTATLGDIVEVGGKMHFVDPLKPGFDPEFQQSQEYLCIRQAIDGCHDIKLQYSGARKSVRVVTPKSVLFARGNYYLSAYCRYARAERTFRMDRIINLEIVGRKG